MTKFVRRSLTFANLRSNFAGMANEPHVWLELRSIRTLNGDSLTSLSQRSGVSLSYLSQLESGQREPNAVVTKKLAQALKVPVSVLMKAHPSAPAVSA